MSQQGGNSQATQSQTGDIMRVGSEKGDSRAGQTEKDNWDKRTTEWE